MALWPGRGAGRWELTHTSWAIKAYVPVHQWGKLSYAHMRASPPLRKVELCVCTPIPHSCKLSCTHISWGAQACASRAAHACAGLPLAQVQLWAHGHQLTIAQPGSKGFKRLCCTWEHDGSLHLVVLKLTGNCCPVVSWEEDIWNINEWLLFLSLFEDFS